MKFLNFMVGIFVVTFLLVSKCEAAENSETLVIFSFSDKVTNVFYYLNYFAEFTQLASKYFPINLLNDPVQVHFGNHNATDLISKADYTNITAAIIVLQHNQEFIENTTTEVKIKPKLPCKDTIVCKLFREFFSYSREPSTKLNLIIVSDVCPDSSNFESFQKRANKKNSVPTTYLITKAKDGKKSCKDTNEFIDYQINPTQNLKDMAKEL